jgi:RHS repeat-associated protein
MNGEGDQGESLNDIVIQAAEFDGLGRRIKKTVTNSGDIDGTTVYYWDKDQIVETRDGSGILQMQVYHGTQYIDEVVGLKLADFGRVYLHQAEGDQGGSLKDYNVIAMTDLTGRTLERYYYSPYGELEVAVDTHVFDCEGDGDLDELDIAAGTSGGVYWGNYSGDCRRLDADADGDIDANDYNAIVAYADTLTPETEIQRVPAASQSRWGNVFGRQGLVFDSEIGSYQNRARQYLPEKRRFMQRDPLLVRHFAAAGYQDGSSVYAYLVGNPLQNLDPEGADSICDKYFFGPITVTECSCVKMTESCNTFELSKTIDCEFDAEDCHHFEGKTCKAGCKAKLKHPIDESLVVDRDWRTNGCDGPGKKKKCCLTIRASIDDCSCKDATSP